MNPNSVRRILIVGGGSSGWLSALYLARFLRHTPVEITLIESAQIGTIGVGEATIPSMVRYLRQLRIDEKEFMQRCSATYKMAIRFDGWQSEDHSYIHPFGLCGGLVDGVDLFHFWLRNRLQTSDPRPYSSYSLQARAAEELKSPRSISHASPIIDAGAYAYHLDAAAMAEYLRELAIADGVKHVFDEVTDVETGPDGLVTSVATVGGRKLEADLFIDCTGFAGLLIEKALGDPWIDLGHLLLCDRAVVLPQERDEDMPPFTKATARDAGWTWEIPLSNRKGSGYVYSSNHISDDEAAESLLDMAAFRRRRTADPRHLKMRVGHRTEFWRGNVVSVGLSSGFVEPLESSGLYFVHRALDLLRNHFPDRSFAAGSRAAFNRQMRSAYDEVRDFIVLHYVLAGRKDTAFWRDARAVPLPDSLQHTLDCYQDGGLLDLEHEWVFRDTNHYFILSGNGQLPRRPTARADVVDFARIPTILAGIDQQNGAELEELPSQRAYNTWLQSQVSDPWAASESDAVSVSTTAD